MPVMTYRKTDKSSWTPATSTAPETWPVIENAKIKGVCPDRFDPVRQALQYNLDSGEDIGASVSKYWPEFAQNGKSGVLVKHILTRR